MNVKVRSFAKINIGLCIGTPRPDGFHGLLTVYQTIGLHDVLHVSVSRGNGIEIRCSDPRVPTDESNTCFRIAEKAMRALRAKGKITIEIDKRLPVQGGLGGASANAVAALLGLERAVKKTLSPAEKLQIAAEVGSDLPLFLVGGTVLGVSRGELVYPLPELPPIACVIVTPKVGVSTPKAFAAWDRLCRAGTSAREELDPQHPAAVIAGLRPARAGESAHPHTGIGPNNSSADAQPKLTVPTTSDRMNELSRVYAAWLSEPYSGAPLRRGRAENYLLQLVRTGIENDFEQVVFPEYPELQDGKRALLGAGAKYASLSGSGSTLYGLFASSAAALRATAKLRQEGWAAKASTTLSRRQYWSRIFDRRFPIAD